MKKTYRLVDLDCANCARRIQDAVMKLDGVEDCAVNFFTQKMTITADDVEALMPAVLKCVKKVEPDCEIVLN